MKTILLMRHAKSSWSQSGVEDHDRILNARGREAAEKMGIWLRTRSLIPDHVLVSTAARAAETWDRMAATHPPDLRPEFHKSLYHSGPDTMLELIKASPPTAKTLLLIAHQPGMSAMTARMADGQQGPDQTRAFSHFPTAGIAVLRAHAPDWASIEFGGCRFETFAVPREIA